MHNHVEDLITLVILRSNNRRGWISHAFSDKSFRVVSGDLRHLNDREILAHGTKSLHLTINEDGRFFTG